MRNDLFEAGLVESFKKCISLLLSPYMMTGTYTNPVPLMSSTADEAERATIDQPL